MQMNHKDNRYTEMGKTILKRFFLLAVCTGAVLTIGCDAGNPASSSSTAPAEAAIGAPANGGMAGSVTPTLEWTGGEDADGDPVTFTVYLDSVNPPASVAALVSNKQFKPAAALYFDQVYYWSVTVSDGASEVAGPVWTFTTPAPSFDRSDDVTYHILSPDSTTTLRVGDTMSIRIYHEYELIPPEDVLISVSFDNGKTYYELTDEKSNTFESPFSVIHNDDFTHRKWIVPAELTANNVTASAVSTECYFRVEDYLDYATNVDHSGPFTIQERQPVSSQKPTTPNQQQ